MTRADVLDIGRECFDRKAWAEAYARLSAAHREEPLGPEDLERLATAARLIGRDAESADLRARAYQEHERRGEPEQAARCAFWLAIELLLEGETARSAGWVSRARRLLGDGRRDCVEQGYLLLPLAVRAAFEGDAEGAYAGFTEVVGIAERFGDRDLVTLARQGQGRSLIRMGQVPRGMALLDEVMVAVTADEVSPVIVGDVYCSVIEACHESFDLRRAQEWTAAAARWCESQPDLVPYRGQCLVRRAEIMQLRGEWPDALSQAERARDWLSQPPARRAVGGAFYQLGELHRLRGAFGDAEEAYRAASAWGREPQPGLALLRLAQGRIAAATSAIRRVAGEAADAPTRSRVLPAYIEIMLAAGDVAAAREAADELGRIAGDLGAPLLRAAAAQSTGAVLLAEGRPQDALAALRTASAGWREVGAPYEEARARVLIGLAHLALGDGDTAAMELDAARRAFRHLGATPDLSRTPSAGPGAAAGGAGGLTAREVEVLGLVATGKTNRAIAGRLGISEKTVARHVSNIFTKLNLSSRAAATAYAYEHRLVQPST
jgi:DNA-binding NarL/FixJ family response regulator